MFMYTLIQKVGVSNIFSLFFEEYKYLHLAMTHKIDSICKAICVVTKYFFVVFNCLFFK